MTEETPVIVPGGDEADQDEALRAEAKRLLVEEPEPTPNGVADLPDEVRDGRIED